MAHGRSAAVLMLGGLLLLLCFQQASADQAGAHSLSRRGHRSAAEPAEGSPVRGLQLLSRPRRSSTPFWRMVGSKPLGAHCLRGLECSTQACRHGHCADPQVKS